MARQIKPWLPSPSSSCFCIKLLTILSHITTSSSSQHHYGQKQPPLLAISAETTLLFLLEYNIFPSHQHDIEQELIIVTNTIPLRERKLLLRASQILIQISSGSHKIHPSGPRNNSNLDGKEPGILIIHSQLNATTSKFQQPITQNQNHQTWTWSSNLWLHQPTPAGRQDDKMFIVILATTTGNWSHRPCARKGSRCSHLTILHVPWCKSN